MRVQDKNIYIFFWIGWQSPNPKQLGNNYLFSSLLKLENTIKGIELTPLFQTSDLDITGWITLS